jgi:hypothetical protein
VRLKLFILGVMVIVACSHLRERLRSREQRAVVVTGDGNFKDVVILTPSPPQKFTVGPAAGLQDDEIEAINSTCPQFAVNAPGLPLATPTDKGPQVFRHCISFDYGGSNACTGFEEKTYGFEVTFTPTQLGPTNNCFVIVQLKGGSSRTIAVSGTGIKPLHDASFSTTKLDFGEQVQAIDSEPPIGVTVENIGSGTLGVRATLTESTPGVFQLASGNLAAHTNQPGVKETFSFRCRPPAGPDGTVHTGTLMFTTDDPDKQTFSVAMSCIGIDSPLQGVNSANIETRVDQTFPIVVGLTNRSQATIQLGTITKSANASPDVMLSTVPSNATLDPGDRVDVTMLWTPSAVSSDTLGDLDVPITGFTTRKVAIAPLAIARRAVVSTDLPADAARVNFGPLCLGTETTRTFRIMPSGVNPATDANYTVDAITPAADLAPFEVTLVGGPQAITVPDGMAEVQVKILALDLGVVEKTLTIDTDIPGGNDKLDVPLRFEGLQAGATASPAQIIFQPTVVTGYTNTETGTFRNCTNGDVQIESVLLDGSSAADFQIAGIDLNGEDRLPPFALPEGRQVRDARPDVAADRRRQSRTRHRHVQRARRDEVRVDRTHRRGLLPAKPRQLLQLQRRVAGRGLAAVRGRLVVAPQTPEMTRRGRRAWYAFALP